MNLRTSTLMIVPFVLTVAACVMTPADHPFDAAAASSPMPATAIDPSLPSAAMALAGLEPSFDEPAPTF